MADYMVTTIDNPYNPFTRYRKWREHDDSHCYHTEEWIYVLSKTSNDLLPEERDEQIDFGVDRLLMLDPYGLHVKVYENEADFVIPMYNKAYNEAFASQHQ